MTLDSGARRRGIRDPFDFYTLRYGDWREILTYHWHPEGLGPITTVHLHLGPASAIRADLRKGYLPTGAVGLEELLQYTIRDLGVRPRRLDWATVLGGLSSG